MVSNGLSYPDIAGCVVYAGTAAACLAAARAAGPFGRPRSEARFWTLAAAMFLALVVWRGLSFEDVVRESLRHLLRAQDEYANRREIQAPLAMLGLAAMVALLVATARSWPGAVRRSRHRRAVAWARAGLVAMAGLVALRLVSLHAIDGLLYGGSFHLNWLLDLGASACVGLAALAYLRAPHRQRRS